MSVLSTLGAYEYPIPVGVILPYMSGEVPSTFLICDGQELNISDYPELYSVIGNTYNVSSPEGKFEVPALNYTLEYVEGTNVNTGATNPAGTGSITVGFSVAANNLPKISGDETNNSFTYTNGDGAAKIAYDNGVVQWDPPGGLPMITGINATASVGSFGKNPGGVGDTNYFTVGLRAEQYPLLNYTNGSPAAVSKSGTVTGTPASYYTNFIIKAKYLTEPPPVAPTAPLLSLDHPDTIIHVVCFGGIF